MDVDGLPASLCNNTFLSSVKSDVGVLLFGMGAVFGGESLSYIDSSLYVIPPFFGGGVIQSLVDDDSLVKAVTASLFNMRFDLLFKLLSPYFELSPDFSIY